MSLLFFPRSLVTTTFGCIEDEAESDREADAASNLRQRRKPLPRWSCRAAEEDDGDDSGGGGNRE